MTEIQPNRMERTELWGGLKDAHDIRAKARIFGQMIPDDVHSIVDVGCGDGAITNTLGERWAVTGVDSSSTALAHVSVDSLLADARNLPFADASFDLALSSQMVEHLDDSSYPAAMAELRRVARRYLLISVPYREDLGMRMVRCPRCRHHQHVWGHVRRFTPESLARDIPEFEPIDVRIFGDVQDPPWPRPLLWMVHRGFGGWYGSAGQNPQCERCGNTDFSGLRGFPLTAWRLKETADRIGRRPRLPYWLAVLARRGR